MSCHIVARCDEGTCSHVFTHAAQSLGLSRILLRKDASRLFFSSRASLHCLCVCVRVCARSPRLHQVCPMLLGPALRVTSRSNGDLAPCICCVPSAQVTKSDPNNNKTRLLCILELLLKAEAKARPSPPAIYASWADVASAAKTPSIFGACFAFVHVSLSKALAVLRDLWAKGDDKGGLSPAAPIV